MKVVILGHHPDLFPGFNSLMTANLAYGFASMGASVTVMLPNTVSHPQLERMEKLGLDLKSLDHFDADIELRVLESNETLEKFDLGIWQSYFADDEPFFPVIRKAARVMAKNFPRLLVGDPTRDLQSLKGVAGRFDIVGLALRTDYDLAQNLTNEIADSVSRSIYMPRGFRADWFSEPVVGGTPVLGIEKGVDTDSTEYAYLIPVIKRLRNMHGPIDVIGARLKDEQITTSTLNLLPARKFYREFLNPLWAYLMIDVNKSRQSMNAIPVNGRNVYPGLYENQVVEAQLAGAAVLGHADALPAELASSNKVVHRFEDYEDEDSIVEFLSGIIKNRAEISQIASSWARKNHSVKCMVKPLYDAV